MSRPLGIVSVITAATALGYARLLAQQGCWPGIDARLALVLGLLAGFMILAGIGTFTRSAVARAATAAVCAGGLLPLGFLSAFSIGLPLLAAGGIALVAWRRAL